MPKDFAEKLPGFPPALADDLPHPIWLKDKHGVYRYVNRAFLRLLDDFRSEPDALPASHSHRDIEADTDNDTAPAHTIAGVIGVADRDLWPADLATAFKSQDSRARRPDHPVHAVQRIDFPEAARWFDIWRLPVEGEGRRRSGVGGIAFEITHLNEELTATLKRRRAEESQARMRSLYALLKAAVRLGRDDHDHDTHVAARIERRIDAICFPMLMADPAPGTTATPSPGTSPGSDPATATPRSGSLQQLLMSLLPGDQHAQLEVSGDPFQIRGPSAQVLSLALCELLNASMRHAALREPAGRVFLSWRCLENDRVEFRWQEVATRPIEVTAEQVYANARQLIEYQLQGGFHASAGPHTLSCSFVLGLEAIGNDPQDAPSESSASASTSSISSSASHRSPASGGPGMTLTE